MCLCVCSPISCLLLFSSFLLSSGLMLGLSVCAVPPACSLTACGPLRRVTKSHLRPRLRSSLALWFPFVIMGWQTPPKGLSNINKEPKNENMAFLGSSTSANLLISYHDYIVCDHIMSALFIKSTSVGLYFLIFSTHQFIG